MIDDHKYWHTVESLSVELQGACKIVLLIIKFHSSTMPLCQANHGTSGIFSVICAISLIRSPIVEIPKSVWRLRHTQEIRYTIVIFSLHCQTMACMFSLTVWLLSFSVGLQSITTCDECAMLFSIFCYLSFFGSHYCHSLPGLQYSRDKPPCLSCHLTSVVTLLSPL